MASFRNLVFRATFGWGPVGHADDRQDWARPGEGEWRNRCRATRLGTAHFSVVLWRSAVGSFGFVFLDKTAFLIAPGRIFGFVWKNSCRSSVVSSQLSGIEAALVSPFIGRKWLCFVILRLAPDVGRVLLAIAMLAIVGAHSLRGRHVVRTGI